MQTILQIGQDAADRAEAQRPSTLFGNDRIGRYLRTGAHDTAREIMRAMVGGQGWSALQATWIFQIVQGVQSYRLPPDFGQMIPDTQHRQSWSVGLLGPVPLPEWHDYLYGLSAPASGMSWRVMNGRLYVEPAPSTTEFATIGYVSNWPVVQPVDGADFLQADVSAAMAARVVLPLVSREGFIGTNAAALGMTAGEFSEKFRLLTPTQGVDVASEAMSRKERFTLDTDQCALDEHLMSLGMTWRLRKSLSQPYAEEKAEFEVELDVRAATDGGGARPISLQTERVDPVTFLEGGRFVIRG